MSIIAVKQTQIYFIVDDPHELVYLRDLIKEKFKDNIYKITQNYIKLFAGLLKIQIITKEQEKRGFLKGIDREAYIFYYTSKDKNGIDKIKYILKEILEKGENN